eukprot:6190905-Pleurochrysis_carterae.AAC.3
MSSTLLQVCATDVQSLATDYAKSFDKERAANKSLVALHIEHACLRPSNQTANPDCATAQSCRCSYE